MHDNASAKEGFVPFAGHQTWYQIVGSAEAPGKLPLLCLHGGPGATWHHMEPYAELAEGRRVICYDQLGCGNSAVTEPHNPSMWTTQLYLDEITAVRAALGRLADQRDLKRAEVLGKDRDDVDAHIGTSSRERPAAGSRRTSLATSAGQPDRWSARPELSWVAGPAGLASLVVESSPASVPFWLTELAKLRAELPAEVEQTLRRHEAAGTTDSEEYQSTMMAFYDRHVCRVRPWPDWLQRTFDGLEANPEVYHTMNGPSEFHVIGPLKDFDITADLGAITVPALLFCGEFDEVTPATMAQARDGIKGSELIVMPGCSHMSQAEDPAGTLGLVRGWLAGIEAARQAG